MASRSHQWIFAHRLTDEERSETNRSDEVGKRELPEISVCSWGMNEDYNGLRKNCLFRHFCCMGILCNPGFVGIKSEQQIHVIGPPFDGDPWVARKTAAAVVYCAWTLDGQLGFVLLVETPLISVGDPKWPSRDIYLPAGEGHHESLWNQVVRFYSLFMGGFFQIRNHAAQICIPETPRRVQYYLMRAMRAFCDRGARGFY